MAGFFACGSHTSLGVLCIVGVALVLHLKKNPWAIFVVLFSIYTIEHNCVYCKLYGWIMCKVLLFFPLKIQHMELWNIHYTNYFCPMALSPILLTDGFSGSKVTE